MFKGRIEKKVLTESQAYNTKRITYWMRNRTAKIMFKLSLIV